MKIIVAIAISITAITVWSDQTQHIEAGEIPNGINAEDWDIIQQAYLKASNTDRMDRFGYSVAISGDTVVVVANGEDSAATGVNGDQSDNSASYAGAVYVFVRSLIGWSQQAYLKASNTDAEDWFGYPVAISGDTIVVGAHKEDSAATGVNGDQTDNTSYWAGAAYVFKFSDSGIFSASITNCSSIPSGFKIEWIPIAGWDSVVKCSPDLVVTPFTNLSAALPYPVNSYTDTASNSKCFYRVDIER